MNLQELWHSDIVKATWLQHQLVSFLLSQEKKMLLLQFVNEHSPKHFTV